MRWEDERYVKLYTRDTVDWLALSFEAQALWVLLLRKFDGAGLIELGRQGKRGIAAAIGHSSRWSDIEPALEELLADGCLVLEGTKAVGVNFIEAQEAKASDKSRKVAQRKRDLDKALAGGEGRASVTGAETSGRVSREQSRMLSHDVTRRHAVSRELEIGHAVSRELEIGHTASRDVTRCHANSNLVTTSPAQLSPAQLREEAYTSTSSTCATDTHTEPGAEEADGSRALACAPAREEQSGQCRDCAYSEDEDCVGPKDGDVCSSFMPAPAFQLLPAPEPASGTVVQFHEAVDPVAQFVATAPSPLMELARQSELPSTPPTPSAEDMQRVWNELAPAKCARWQRQTEPRRKAAKARLEEHKGEPGGPLAWWERTVRKVAASSFLRGDKAEWCADIDWLLKPANLVKVEEGKYDDRAGNVRDGSARAEDQKHSPKVGVMSVEEWTGGKS